MPELLVKPKVIKPKTNNQMIKLFLSNERFFGSVNNLQIVNHVDAKALIHYNTCILEYEYVTNTLHINETHYSKSTSRVQSLINYNLASSDLLIKNKKIYNNINIDTRHLFN